MFSERRNFLFSGLALLLGFLSIVTLTASDAVAKGKSASKIEGTLVAINSTTGVLSVRRTNGTVVSVTVPGNAKIERNNLHASLRLFRIGDRVQVKFNTAGVIFKVEATGR